MSIPGLL
ncbi:uncharacterized protein FFM5_04372 [Fusarium fujikuroi]|nr:uncharacterized protein FFM5_04372 [Fusarium fujikuroi]